MLYLGGLSGAGILKCNGEEIVRATYDFEGYMRPPFGVTCSGEIGMPAAILKDLFGRRDVQLLTDDGRLLDLRFSEKKLGQASETAHVDVTGQLPTDPKNWRH
jgi:hypothetical protein